MSTQLDIPATTPLRPERPSRRRLAARGAVALVVVILLVMAPALLRLARNPAGGPAVLGVDQVTVRDNAFDPPVIQVQRGATVTWTFDDDGRQHNIVGDEWASDVSADGTYRHTFTAAGQHPYRCTLHLGMAGRVDVAE